MLNKSLNFVSVFVFIISIYFNFVFTSGFFVRILDVGQGDSILIRSDHNKYILIDIGDGKDILSELGKYLPFYVRKINIVVITHFDNDHSGGFDELTSTYDVLCVFANYDQSTEYQKVKNITASNDIQLLSIQLKDYFEIDGLRLDCIWPDLKHINDQTSKNDKSIVLILKYKNVGFIFTGDIEENEKLIIDKIPHNNNYILKVSHHGSKTASGLDFLLRVNILVGFISCGQNNKFNHPSPEVIENFQDNDIPIFRSDISGSILIYENMGDWKIVLEKKSTQV